MPIFTNRMKTEALTTRPPVVVVMGHIDHGKSTLLDYIRRSNIVDGEAGGITQHLSAYEVIHKDKDAKEQKITFLDTPGHAAFTLMRARGALAADIAILVVSAEDSVKAQTVEAWKTIMESGIPYVVAINKIDKPNANIEKVKQDLSEHGVYLEGYGGDIPFAAVSSKTGAGIDELLDLILIVSEVANLAVLQSKPAEGYIIEARLDAKRGITATLILKDGTLKSGMFIVSGNALATTRIMEDFNGKAIKEVHASSPVGIVGWSVMPDVGSLFVAYGSKKEAEQAQEDFTNAKKSGTQGRTDEMHADDVVIVPIVIKTDVFGTSEAVLNELLKLNDEKIKIKCIAKGAGAIGEADVKLVLSDPNSIIIGFNTKLDSKARELVDANNVNIQLFDIIYKISDYMKEIIDARRPRFETAETTGMLKVLKTFSRTKDKQIVGGRVIEGVIASDAKIKIMRRDFEIGTGTIINMESGKMKVREVAQDTECGIHVETKTEIAPGDVLVAYKMITK